MPFKASPTKVNSSPSRCKEPGECEKELGLIDKVALTLVFAPSSRMVRPT